MAFLRYEERIRIERANGLRDPDLHTHSCGCTSQDDAEYKNKKFSDVAATPLRLNTVCPHPKVVVPVTPAFVVEEPVKVITSRYPTQPFRMVDFNPLDGRIHGVLETIEGTPTPAVHASTIHAQDVGVVDTVYDSPMEVPVLKQSLADDGVVAQPLQTGDKTVRTTVKKVDDGDDTGII